MRTESVNNLNFNGIYKLKLTNSDSVNKTIEDFISAHDYVMRKTKIFQEQSDKFMYVITTEGKLDETIFEKDLRDVKVPFWKALSVNKLLNKNMVDTLFDLTKKNEGKENWII